MENNMVHEHTTSMVRKPIAYAVYQIAGDCNGIVLRTVKPWAGDDSMGDDDGMGEYWAGNTKLYELDEK